MKITHVIRGEEWISSLPKHIELYKALQWTPPKFYHLPLLLNPDKSKLSKRQGDVAVEDFLNNGYIKEALINFVALLGWHPDSNQEIFNINELIEAFSISRINKSGAIFDKEKLNWMNKEYIKNIDTIDFQKIVKEILKTKDLLNIQIDIAKIASYAKDRINQLTQIWDEIQCFFIYNKTKGKDLNQYEYKKLFLFWINELNELNELNETNVKNIISNTKETLNISGKDLFIPLAFVILDKKMQGYLRTI